jgi:calcineurin-like phosphoesterase
MVNITLVVEVKQMFSSFKKVFETATCVCSFCGVVVEVRGCQE